MTPSANMGQLTQRPGGPLSRNVGRRHRTSNVPQRSLMAGSTDDTQQSFQRQNELGVATNSIDTDRGSLNVMHRRKASLIE